NRASRWESHVSVLTQDRRLSAISVAATSSTIRPMAIPSTSQPGWKRPTNDSAPVITFSDTLTFNFANQVAELASRSRLPLMSPFHEIAVAGGLMSYGPSISDLFRRQALYVEKILRGAKPADLPVEQPIKFELVINLKTAKALGLTVPPSLLARADEVIE